MLHKTPRGGLSTQASSVMNIHPASHLRLFSNQNLESYKSHHNLTARSTEQHNLCVHLILEQTLKRLPHRCSMLTRALVCPPSNQTTWCQRLVYSPASCFFNACKTFSKSSAAERPPEVSLSIREPHPKHEEGFRPSSEM